MSIYKYAVKNNVWLWFHIMAGGFLMRVFLHFMSDQTAFLSVLAIAVLWEIIEYFVTDINAIYGSRKVFLTDSLGDVAGACIMAIICLI